MALLCLCRCYLLLCLSRPPVVTYTHIVTIPCWLRSYYAVHNITLLRPTLFFVNSPVRSSLVQRVLYYIYIHCYNDPAVYCIHAAAALIILPLLLLLSPAIPLYLPIIHSLLIVTIHDTILAHRDAAITPTENFSAHSIPSYSTRIDTPHRLSRGPVAHPLHRASLYQDGLNISFNSTISSLYIKGFTFIIGSSLKKNSS